MPKEIRLTVRGIELAALHWHAQAEVRILALHGWLDNAESFTPLAQKLPECQIAALDFPGHGHSGHRPDGEILHYVDYIADVHQVLDDLGWNQCVLMGHSMGAGVASIFASAFAQRLSGLICLDGLGPITCDVDELPGRLNKSVRLNLTAPAKPKSRFSNLQQAVKARYQAGDLSKPSVELLVKRNLSQNREGYHWRSDSRMRLPSMYYLSEQQARAYLKHITVPTLMLRPVDSGYRALAVLKQRAALIQNLIWHDVPGKHHVHMDDPDAVVPCLIDFINSLK